MKKMVCSTFLAMIMLVSMMATAAFAAVPEEAMEPEVHCVTLNVADVLALGEQSMDKTVSPSLSLGGYQSGWSTGASTNFGIPSGATVVKAKVIPGKATAGGSITSAIAVSKFRLTSPNGKYVDLAFSTMGMETTSFNGLAAQGNWTLSIYGSNVGQSLGSIAYKSATITIWYTI